MASNPAVTKRAPDFVLNSLRGGMNNEDPPNVLQNDECVLAENVEFFFSSLGERRAGCEQLVELEGSTILDGTVVVNISQFFPESTVLDPEIFVISAEPNVEAFVAHRVSGTWFTVTPVDDIDPDEPEIYNIHTQMLHGKQFFAYPSDQDRLHVWDGSSLRRTGLAQPVAAPTGANEGSGSFTSTRYYRVRFIEKDGDDILRRSEPSEVLTFNPSGSGAGVTVTRPALVSEGETHWELEASDDGPEADFYRIFTTAVGTSTVNDETPVEGYPDAGPLSEDIGEYLLIPSARYLAADDDRLIFAGSFTDPEKSSQIGWTPPENAEGAGNDERLPLAVNNTVNLDNFEGGGLTGISQSAHGSFYAFKWNHIYQIIRTGDATRAYEVIPVSKVRGALPGSVVSGIDETGRGCIYFIDPVTGPSRIGRSGLQRIGGIRGTYERINLTAEKVTCHGVYYPNKRQVHWWIATEGADTPNMKIVLQTNLIKGEGEGEISGGWSIATGHIADAYCSAIINELLSDNDLTTLIERPFIGVLAPEYILRCDIREEDSGSTYRAIIRSKPYFLAGLLNMWGGMNAALFATAHDTAQIQVKMIKNFGLEEQTVTTDLLATAAGEEFVIKYLDNLELSESIAIQFEFSDPEE